MFVFYNLFIEISRSSINIKTNVLFLIPYFTHISFLLKCMFQELSKHIEALWRRAERRWQDKEQTSR